MKRGASSSARSLITGAGAKTGPPILLGLISKIVSILLPSSSRAVLLIFCMSVSSSLVNVDSYCLFRVFDFSTIAL